MDAHLSLSSNVLLTPARAGLRAGADNTVEVLVRVQAADAPPEAGAPRPPQAIALVLDRSGSMAGRPLAQALRCAEYVSTMLRPSDIVSVVAFDDRVELLSPARPLGDGQAVRAALAGVTDGGSTNLHGGWHAGVESLAPVAGAGLKRVILLSDGQANHGLTDATQIAAQCAEQAARGISTSTYGLGRSFNEDLMVAMARSGGGNQYYGDSADDLMEPFQQELELLGNLALRDMRLTATAHEGIELEMRNRLHPVDGAWRLPDLAWGAEAWAAFRLRVPAAVLPPPGQSLALLRVAVRASTLQGVEVAMERTALSLPVLAPAAWDALPDDEDVRRRFTELDAADTLAAMRAAAGDGDWGRVDQLLGAARERFAGHAWLAAMLQAMTALAAERDVARSLKELAYSSDKLRNRLVRYTESAAFSVADELEVPAYLRRKPVQGKDLGADAGAGRGTTDPRPSKP